jgi:hypothetical protein
MFLLTKRIKKGDASAPAAPFWGQHAPLTSPLMRDKNDYSAAKFFCQAVKQAAKKNFGNVGGYTLFYLRAKIE